jgi:protein kinase-like protein
MTFPPDGPTPSFPYQIETRIGEGAMGVVYRAVEPVLERRVAIKSLRPQMLSGEDPETAREYRLRFLQEARAAAALSHPGAATIYRIGEEEGAPYIAMEWLEGQTLEEVLRDEGRLPVERAVPLILDLLATLDAAHKSGVVHRDVKPANLVLLADGRLKVTDFGIARLKGKDLVKTQAGFVLATPRFASPEQLRGDDVDGRSDLFAAGILLFHLLTGRFPFAGGDFLQVASAIFRDPPTPLRSIDPTIPPALAAVVDKALAKDRENRFCTAAEMAEALRTAAAQGARAGAGTPTVPVPDATPMILRGLPAERPLAAAAAARSWPARELGTQASGPLLDRLLDRPLHAPAFAGAALLGAVDTRTGETGDGVVERLPDQLRAVLHPVPEGLGAGCVRGLASLLHPARLRHEGLDSSFVSLPALAGKLREEGFDGILSLRRNGSVGTVIFRQGSPVLSLFSGAWDGVAIERPWEEWVSGVALRAGVEEHCEVPCFVSFRRELRNREVAVPSDAPVPAADGLLGGDPIHRFLRWSLREIPPFFRERDRTAKWKYLVEWLADVRRAVLHHDLPRTGTTATDAFDLATFDAEGRVLHLARRVVKGTPEALAQLKEDVIRAKSARLKTGDVGGAFLIARSFDEATLEAWRAGDKPAGASGRWSFGIEESFTGYEGFVRVGPRRGFHLLLVQEMEDGGFVPVLI